jgi:hypothetical protein
VEALDDIDEVLYIVSTTVLDAKTIYDKEELHWLHVMLPHARCVGCGSIAGFGEVFLELFVHNDAGLW